MNAAEQVCNVWVLWIFYLRITVTSPVTLLTAHYYHPVVTHSSGKACFSAYRSCFAVFPLWCSLNQHWGDHSHHFWGGNCVLRYHLRVLEIPGLVGAVRRSGLKEENGEDSVLPVTSSIKSLANISSLHCKATCRWWGCTYHNFRKVFINLLHKVQKVMNLKRRL